MPARPSRWTFLIDIHHLSDCMPILAFVGSNPSQRGLGEHLSVVPTMASSAGTKEPICARKTIIATYRATAANEEEARDATQDNLSFVV